MDEEYEALGDEVDEVGDLGQGEPVDQSPDEVEYVSVPSASLVNVVQSEDVQGAVPAFADNSNQEILAAVQDLLDNQQNQEPQEVTVQQEYIDAIDNLRLTLSDGFTLLTGLIGLLVGCLAGKELFKVWMT